MTTDHKIARRKLSLLALSGEMGTMGWSWEISVLKAQQTKTIRKPSTSEPKQPDTLSRGDTLSFPFPHGH